MKATIPEADYYDCDDSAETLSHETPADAIDYWLEGFDDDKGTGIGELLKSQTPVTLYAYKRETIDDIYFTEFAKSALEHVRDLFANEDLLGNPEGSDDYNGLTDGVVAAHLPAMTDLIRQFLSNARVWHCERIAEVELSAEDVEEMMRAHCPEWFEEAGR